VSLLTVAELAVALRMSESWVRKGVLERRLPFTKLGRSIRFTPAQVEAIVSSGAQTADPDHTPRRHSGAPRTRL
jgi:excisionase family DNA binding protein